MNSSFCKQRLALPPESLAFPEMHRDSVKALLTCICERRVRKTDIYRVFTSRLQALADAFFRNVSHGRAQAAPHWWQRTLQEKTL
jgi:hypothetical protein